jgi:hypothetical protein
MSDPTRKQAQGSQHPRPEELRPPTKCMICGVENRPANRGEPVTHGLCLVHLTSRQFI